jgi:hypothetical protein
MKVDYATLMRQDRRLSILRTLQGAENETANDSMVTRIVNMYGVNSTRDQVRTELLWLREQGFVAIETIDTTMVASLVERGTEIATGRATHPEITRPSRKS